MYVLAKNNSLVALNATTGEELWIHANLSGITRRGINYWENEDRSDRRIMITINNMIQAIDATTGKSILTFGKDGVYSATMAQGTGVYEKYVGLEITGVFIGQLPDGSGIYHMTPK